MYIQTGSPIEIPPVLKNNKLPPSWLCFHSVTMKKIKMTTTPPNFLNCAWGCFPLYFWGHLPLFSSFDVVILVSPISHHIDCDTSPRICQSILSLLKNCLGVPPLKNLMKPLNCIVRPLGHWALGGRTGPFRFPQFYISSSFVKIRLHSKIPLPSLTLFGGVVIVVVVILPGWKQSQLLVFWLKTWCEFDN